MFLKRPFIVKVSLLCYFPLPGISTKLKLLIIKPTSFTNTFLLHLPPKHNLNPY